MNTVITDNNIIKLKSLLLSFATILEKLLGISVNKQNAILEQNWNEVFMLTNDQQEVAAFINEKDAELNSLLHTVGKRPDEKLDKLKFRIRELIACYKETEGLNAQMLNDNMFAVKQKFEKLYNLKNNDVYTKDMKKQNIDTKKAMLVNNLA